LKYGSPLNEFDEKMRLEVVVGLFDAAAELRVAGLLGE